MDYRTDAKQATVCSFRRICTVGARGFLRKELRDKRSDDERENREEVRKSFRFFLSLAILSAAKENLGDQGIVSAMKA